MAKKKALPERERLAASLFASLPDAGGNYEVSTAFSAPERRKLLGPWLVAEHQVGGKPYLECFAASSLRGATLLSPSYVAVYDFRDSLCVKKVHIEGQLELRGALTEYSYRMSMAISWQLGRGFILVRPELGYQSTSLGGETVAVKEFDSLGGDMRLTYCFEGESLVLEEGQDRKVLRRSPA
jgi:hypothetical protein